VHFQEALQIETTREMKTQLNHKPINSEKQLQKKEKKKYPLLLFKS
jgi:hypothetical protein